MEGSDMKVVRDYFGPFQHIADFKAQWDQLTIEDRLQLGEGIRSGSLTY